MNEETALDVPRKCLKVNNILRANPTSALYKRPIDYKIDQIRKKLKTIALVKLKRSSSQPRQFDENNTELATAHSLVLHQANILRPQDDNILPPILRNNKKLLLPGKPKLYNHDILTSKVKTEFNDSPEPTKPRNLPLHLYPKSSNPRQPHSKTLGPCDSPIIALSIFQTAPVSNESSTTSGKQQLSVPTLLSHRLQENQLVLSSDQRKHRRKIAKTHSQSPLTCLQADENLSAGLDQPIKHSTSKKYSTHNNSNAKKPIKLIQATTTHKDFIHLIGLCNEFYFEHPGPYSYFVGKGNNPEVVRRAMKRRGWVESSCIENANFVWSQKKSLPFLQAMEALQFKQVSVKDMKMRTKFYLPSKIQQKEDESLFQRLIGKDQSGFSLREDNSPSQQRSKVEFVNQKIYTLDAGSRILLHNHFINHHEISYKRALFQNMKAYYEGLGMDPFQHVPTTFHIKSINDPEWSQYRLRHEQSQSEGQLWILKPAENTNRGTGICVKETLEDIRSFVLEQQMEKPGMSFIIQEYLSPMLYNKRKFDVRCYTMVTVVNGKLRAYWYDEGYVRTSCKPFSSKNLKNKYIHLTNDAIQKNCDEYGKYQPGNKLSFDDLRKFIDKTLGDQQFDSRVCPTMMRLAHDSIAATCDKLSHPNHNFCFQILGLDFMIDEAGKVWLIEVNRNPCLETSTSLLCRVISSMLEDAFQIAIDPLFPSEEPARTNSPGAFQANRFRLIFEKQLRELSKAA